MKLCHILGLFFNFYFNRFLIIYAPRFTDSANFSIPLAIYFFFHQDTRQQSAIKAMMIPIIAPAPRTIYLALISTPNILNTSSSYHGCFWSTTSPSQLTNVSSSTFYESKISKKSWSPPYNDKSSPSQGVMVSVGLKT